MSRKFRTLVGPLGLMGAALIVAALIGEVWLRSQRYGEEYPDARPPLYVRVYDPSRGYYLRPNQTVTWRGVCFDNSGIQINSFGMRDRDRSLEKLGPRVALLGDSFLRAFEVSDGGAINRRLEQFFPGTEFLNFGESGYGTIQAYQTYRSLARQFKPDVVLLFMYPNDLFDNHYLARGWQLGYPGSVAPGFDGHPDLVRATDGTWTFVPAADRFTPIPEIPVPTSSTANGATTGTAMFRPSVRSLRTWMSQNVRLYVLGSRTKEQLRRRLQSPQDLLEEERAKYPAAVNQPYPRQWATLAGYEPPRNQYIDEAWEITVYSLRELRDAVAADGAMLMVVGIPEREILRIEARGFAQVTGLNPPSTFDTSYFYDQIAKELVPLGVPFVNLQKEFVARLGGAAPALQMYHECNVHWSDAGHEVSARITAERLRERGLPAVRVS
jgi:hypothetical protein